MKESSGTRRIWGRETSWYCERDSQKRSCLNWFLRGNRQRCEDLRKESSSQRVSRCKGPELEIGLQVPERERYLEKNNQWGDRNKAELRLWGLRIWILYVMLQETMGNVTVLSPQRTLNNSHISKLCALSIVIYLGPLSTASRAPSYSPQLPFQWVPWTTMWTWSQISWVSIPALPFTSWMTLGELLDPSFGFLAWKVRS